MAPAIGPTLSLVSTTLTKLPPTDELIRDGHALLEASMEWMGGRPFADADTFSYRLNTQKSSPTWFCRVTQLRKEDISFDELWRKLAVNKLENEKK
ncbi:hypothetical protein C0991_008055 [Blastosporella zonata]|nr:hypothetical protein C0991_008055 [Blastosporella zonata]